MPAMLRDARIHCKPVCHAQDPRALRAFPFASSENAMVRCA
jgi:hypothetical protein